MIPNWLKTYLNEDDISQIEKAVAQAELKTNGEIVPVIVRQSAATRSLFGFLFALLFLSFFSVSDLLLKEMLDLSTYPAAAISILIYLSLVPISARLSQSEFIIRRFIHPLDLDQQAYQRAILEFYSLDLNKTDGSTGVLIFISMVDHEVVILGDKAINDKIKENEWEKIKDQMLVDLKQKEVASAFIKAINSAGLILEKHFPKGLSNPNELKNKLIIRD